MKITHLLLHIYVRLYLYQKNQFTAVLIGGIIGDFKLIPGAFQKGYAPHI